MTPYASGATPPLEAFIVPISVRCECVGHPYAWVHENLATSGIHATGEVGYLAQALACLTRASDYAGRIAGVGKANYTHFRVLFSMIVPVFFAVANIQQPSP